MKKSEERPFLILGQNISSRRKRLGLSQESFAHRAGVSIGALKDIERGVSEGHIDNRNAIAETLSCSLADLYRDPSIRSWGEMSFAAELLSKFSALPQSLQFLALAIIMEDESYIDAVPEGVSRVFEQLLKAYAKSSSSRA